MRLRFVVRGLSVKLMFLLRANLGRWRALLLSAGVLLPLLVLATFCPCLLAGQMGNPAQDTPGESPACCEHCCPPAKTSGQHQPASRVACCGAWQATVEKADRLASDSILGARHLSVPDASLSMLLAAHYRQALFAAAAAAAEAPPRDPPTIFSCTVSRRCFPSNAPPTPARFLS